MRKMTKVLVATALLALGASFTSMAAAKTGTWMLEDDGWYCYDKEGEAYEDEFCLSYGKEYYVGDDGLMVTDSWVEYDDAFYYVGSAGAKTVNDWRFVTPEEDDEAEAEWFYFNNKGKRVSGKQVIDGKTYYFDEDGKMLTGWVTYGNDKAEVAEFGDSVIYCGEDGARLSKEWVKTWRPGTEEDEQEDATLYWYYIGSKGGVTKGRSLDINGETYFFNEAGEMLDGWVAAIDADEDGKFDEYMELGYEDSNEKIMNYTNGVYYCGGADQGWAKKNTWIKTWAPSAYYEADADVTQNWYWIAKSGKVYVPTTSSDAECMTFMDGSKAVENAFYATNSDATKIAFKEVNDKMYAFDQNAAMLSGLVLVEDTDMYYFGGDDDGEMKTGSVTIEDEEGNDWKFFFGKKKDTEDGYYKGVGVTGAASGELYELGLIQTSGDAEYKVVDLLGVHFVVDEDGDIRTSKKEYKDEDNKTYIDTTEDNVEFTDGDGIYKGSFEYLD